MRDDDDEQQLKIELLSQWKLEAESRNFQRRKIYRESREQKEDRNMVRKRRGRGVKLVQHWWDGARDDDEA